MWIYEKRLQYPVHITQTNAKLAQVIISQFGGPDGELAASQRYLSQRYTMPYDECRGLLTDIGTEESVQQLWKCIFPILFQSTLPQMGLFFLKSSLIISWEPENKKICFFLCSPAANRRVFFYCPKLQQYVQ